MEAVTTRWRQAVKGLLATTAAGLLAAACQAATPNPTPTTPPPSPAATATPAPTVVVAEPTVGPSPTPLAPSPSPVPDGEGRTLTLENRPVMPDLDLYDLVARIRPGADLIPPPVRAREEVGHQETFWAVDLKTNRPFTVTATLRAATPHADFYVENGMQVSDAAIAEAARTYEEEVYPRVTREFRPERLGPDARPMTLLHLDLPAVAGYYDSTDEYPRGVYPNSNGRRMLYLNAAYAPPGSAEYISLLAHELQHAVHWEADASDEVWINEGLSVLAGGFFDGSEFLVQAFLRLPSTQLTTWPAQASLASADYGAAGLLMEYVQTHYPGRDGTLSDLVGEPRDGLDGLGAFLDGTGYSVTWGDLLAEWAAANYLDGRSSWDPYPARTVAVPATRAIRSPGIIHLAPNQFAGTYVDLDLPGGDYRIVFKGETRVALLSDTASIEPGHGAWWSGGEDAADARLTRTFDLTGLDRAALRLRVWHDIERDWDFAYLLASRDGGRTWEFLQTQGMVAEQGDGLGQAFGPGYTGWSGNGTRPRWTEETADLSAYTGGEVMVRLEYVTDGAVNLDGIALGGAWLPEAGYAWDGVGDGGWQAEGFFRTNGWARQNFAARVLLVKTDGSHEIIPVPVDDEGIGEVLLQGLGSVYQHAAVMVFPMAPVTRQPASFSLETYASP